MSLHRTCCCGEVDAECVNLEECGLATSYNVSAIVNVSNPNDPFPGCNKTLTISMQNGVAIYGQSGCACTGAVEYYQAGAFAHRFRARGYVMTGNFFGSVSGSISSSSQCGSGSVFCPSISGNGNVSAAGSGCGFGIGNVYRNCSLLCVNEVDTGRAFSKWYWALSVAFESIAQSDPCPQIGPQPRFAGCFSVVSEMQDECHPPPATGWGFGTSGGFPGQLPPYFHGFFGGGTTATTYTQSCNQQCRLEARSGQINAAVTIT